MKCAFNFIVKSNLFQTASLSRYCHLTCKSLWMNLPICAKVQWTQNALLFNLHSIQQIKRFVSKLDFVLHSLWQNWKSRYAKITSSAFRMQKSNKQALNAELGFEEKKFSYSNWKEDHFKYLLSLFLKGVSALLTISLFIFWGGQ